MNDLFLKVDGMNGEDEAVTWSINAALQRNKVYRNDEDDEVREKFRARWKELIREESQACRKTTLPISDEGSPAWAGAERRLRES